MNRKKRTILFITSILILLVPGCVLLISTITTDIQGVNPFGFTAAIISASPFIVIVALFIAIIVSFRNRKRLIITAAILLLNLIFIPINNALENKKIQDYFYENKEVLETISTSLFLSEITIQEAYEICEIENLTFQNIQFDSQQQIVFFIIDRQTVSCYGIAFRFSGLQPTNNPCRGKIDKWKNIENGWFMWSAI